MTDNNSDRSTIHIIREMLEVMRQLTLLDALEQLLQVAKDDDDALKLLPLVKSMANYTSAQIAKDTSEQHKELNPILISLLAILEEKQEELP